MVSNIFNKIEKLPRSLKKKEPEEKKLTGDKILVISTHGCDQKLMKIFQNVEKNTPILREHCIFEEDWTLS